MTATPQDHGLSADDRRSRIRSLTSTHRYVGVADLAARFGVSDVTIRSDLERLQSNGDVDRVRGGAVGSRRTALERTFAHQLGSRAEEKAAIAKIAAGLLEPSEAVFLDSGTTCVGLSRELATHVRRLGHLVVVTNSLPGALELEESTPPYEVIVTGGTLRPMQHSLVDPMGNEVADQLHVDTAFIGCTGIDVEAGITNINLPEAAVKQRWQERATRTVVLADGSKLGARSLAGVCPLSAVDVLITGWSAPDDQVSHVRELGVEVHVAEES